MLCVVCCGVMWDQIVTKLGQRVQDAFELMESCLHITSPKVYYRCEVWAMCRC